MHLHQAVSLGPTLLGLALVALTSCAPAPERIVESAAARSAMVLSESPQAALLELQAASMKGPVAVFKHSPICPISGAAHERFEEWMGGASPEDRVEHAHIDVIAEKPLARGLVAELGIKHESPQILLFHQGEMVWHASHGAITGEALTEQLLLLE